jgi:hypothetical protein
VTPEELGAELGGERWPGGPDFHPSRENIREADLGIRVPLLSSYRRLSVLSDSIWLSLVRVTEGLERAQDGEAWL